MCNDKERIMNFKTVKSEDHRLNQVPKVTLLGRTAANRYDIQPGQSVQGPRFKLGTSRIGGRKVIHSIGKCG